MKGGEQHGQNLEIGKSQGARELARNSILPEPREHARLGRVFPEPRGLQPSRCAHAAPQVPKLIWSVGSWGRDPFPGLAGGQRM